MEKSGTRRSNPARPVPQKGPGHPSRSVPEVPPAEKADRPRTMPSAVGVLNAIPNRPIGSVGSTGATGLEPATTGFGIRCASSAPAPRLKWPKSLKSLVGKALESLWQEAFCARTSSTRRRLSHRQKRPSGREFNARSPRAKDELEIEDRAEVEPDLGSRHEKPPTDVDQLDHAEASAASPALGRVIDDVKVDRR